MISEDKRKQAEEKIESTIKWLESHKDAEASEYERKVKDLEQVIHPLF